VSAFVDTSILVRHLTGDPPEQAARASRFLAAADELLLADLVVAEVVYVLESFYEVPRTRVAELVRAIIAFPAIVVLDPAMLLRALEVYETVRLDFAEAYLVAQAERPGVGAVASFDKAIDRVTTVRRIAAAMEPGQACGSRRPASRTCATGSGANSVP
jgi:predicted nucleic acid-binding protein